jgi:DNA-binding MarR family transcriptional regulator
VSESSLSDTDEDIATVSNGGLDLDGLPDLLGFHVRLAQVAMYRDFAAAMSPLELTQKQGAVLELINANPGVSQVDLAATLGTDRATMMAIIDRLQARDFVVRRRSSGDRRRQELYLTDLGVVIVAKLKRLIAQHERNFTARFTEAELGALMDGLRRIHQQF